jgi:hypothetical protein
MPFQYPENHGKSYNGTNQCIMQNKRGLINTFALVVINQSTKRRMHDDEEDNDITTTRDQVSAMRMCKTCHDRLNDLHFALSLPLA